MLPLYFSSVLFYLLATLSVRADLRKNNGRVSPQTLALWILALVLHTVVVMQFGDEHGFNFSFFKALSILFGLFAGLLLLGSHFRGFAPLGLIVLPLAAASVVLAAFDSGERVIADTIPAGLRIHIFTAFLAYGVLMLAGVHALAMTVRKRQLATHRTSPLLDALPPLEAMEVFLVRLLVVGVAFLSVSLISGFLIYDNLLEQHLAHKTFFSVAAWLVFVAILWNRLRDRWHGGKLVSLTLWGIGLLIVAYFGSKFVLEFLLQV